MSHLFKEGAYMSPAARVGDQTSHGTPLTGMGSANVFIEGLPAWRADVDFHSCPLTDGPKAHAGGTVAHGSTKVFVNGFPAARQGDMIVEAGPSNNIAAGSAKVDIGG
jgi:uncharacterized Zn-binding protein involved in type VI secretion